MSRKNKRRLGVRLVCQYSIHTQVEARKLILIDTHWGCTPASPATTIDLGVTIVGRSSVGRWKIYAAARKVSC
jgi:hypothetical protein